MQGLIFDTQKSLSDIIGLRDDYLNNLIEPQELYLELFVRKSNVHLIKLDGVTVGYFISDENGNLFEYHILNPWLKIMDDILRQLIPEFGIEKIYCKSFDLNLLTCSLDIQKKSESIGYLFRDYKKNKLQVNTSDIRTRLATCDDFNFVNEVNEEIFENETEIKETINNESMLLFCNDKEIIGFGIFQRAIPGYNSFDIGMLIVEKYRKKGYGTYIIQYLTDLCLENNWRPTCGCAIDNIGSRKTLEKAGYTTQHRMLLFHL